MAKVISIFGGASPRPETPDYEEARALGAELARAGWTVATGGYAGMMEAASRGAGEAGGHVVGVTCTLIENWRGIRANAWVREEKRFETLRDRLYHLVEFSDAALALPGGIGTLTEVALTWSLMQAGEIKAKPLVAVGRVWTETLATFLQAAGPYVRPEDRQLLYLAEDAADAVRFLGKG